MTIDDYPEHFQFRRSEWTRPFVGRVELTSLPRPSKETLVNFYLEIPPSSLLEDDEDWTIRLDYRRSRVSLLSDSVFVWPRPHRRGDTYSGSLRFKPKSSGVWGITIYKDNEMMPKSYKVTLGLNLTWCLDEVGQLLYLGNAQFKNVNLDPPRVHFFEGDTIRLGYDYDAPNYLFNPEILITPLPSFDDTFSLFFKLIAATELPSGVDLRISSWGVSLVDFPSRLNAPQFNGDTLDILIRAYPLAVSTGHRIHLQFWKDYGNRQPGNIQDVFCLFQFDEKGELMFVNNESMNVNVKYVPKGFPSKVPKVAEDMIIHKDGTVERR
jgi:hypothetical protein